MYEHVAPSLEGHQDVGQVLCLVGVVAYLHDLQLSAALPDVLCYLSHVDAVALAEVKVSLLMPCLIELAVGMGEEGPFGEIVVGMAVELALTCVIACV